MADQNTNQQDLILQLSDGRFLKIDVKQLKPFIMPDDEVESFLKKNKLSQTQTCTTSTCLDNTNEVATAGTLPSAGVRMVPNAGVRMVPNAGVRMAPNAGVRMAPNAGVRMAPNAGVRMAPNVGVRMVPNAGVRMVPNAGVRMSPNAGVRMAPKMMSAINSQSIISSWLT